MKNKTKICYCKCDLSVPHYSDDHRAPIKDKYAIITYLERGIVPLQLSNFLLTFKTLKAADKAAFKYEKLYRKDCRVISLDSVHE